MEAISIFDEKFKKYGRVWKDLPSQRLIKEMEHAPLPKDVIYVPSVEDMENTPEAKEYENKVFGGLPIQIGYCNGNCNELTALEYHRNSEINIAVTDMLLALGWLPDVTESEEGFDYDTTKVEVFYVPAGTVLEMYSTTLHYAPWNADENGFKCIVILPKGTNTDIDFKLSAKGEDRIQTAKNKWLLEFK